MATARHRLPPTSPEWEAAQHLTLTEQELAARKAIEASYPLRTREELRADRRLVHGQQGDCGKMHWTSFEAAACANVRGASKPEEKDLGRRAAADRAEIEKAQARAEQLGRERDALVNRVAELEREAKKLGLKRDALASRIAELERELKAAKATPPSPARPVPAPVAPLRLVPVPKTSLLAQRILAVVREDDVPSTNAIVLALKERGGATRQEVLREVQAMFADDRLVLDGGFIRTGS